MAAKRILISLLAIVFTIGLFAPVIFAEGDYRDNQIGGVAPLHLVKSFEDLLHRQESLLNSFQSLVNLYHIPPIELLRSYEDLLRRQALLLDSFEEVARPYACGVMRPDLSVIASYERLLHGQAALLGTFEGLLHKLPEVPVMLIESFEDLLRRQANLVTSFEAMLHCLAERHRISPRELYPFLTSFETLIRSQSALLMSFESLVKGTRGGAPVEMPPYHDQKPMHEMPEHQAPPPPDYGKPPYDAQPKPYTHEASDRAELRYFGNQLPDLDAIKEFARVGAYMVQSGRVRDLFTQRAALTERSAAMILAYKLGIDEMFRFGMGERAVRAIENLNRFRLELSMLQGELVKRSLKLTVVPASMGGDAYHKYDDGLQLIVSNTGPFTINMTSLAIMDNNTLVASIRLGTIEPGEHKIVQLGNLDPYMVRLVAENARVTGFIQMFSKLFQAAMM